MPAGNLKVALIYIDSGGGHRAAAEALLEVIRAQGRPWDVHLISIQDLFRPIDYIRKYTGIDFQDVYNIMLRRGWTLGSTHMIPVMHWLMRKSHKSQVRELEAFWKEFQPDLVVSMIPHFNRAMKEALTRVSPDVPYVTLLTDIGDYPPHFWIERQDQFVICGSERAATQAAEIGLPADRILRTSGMILHTRFYKSSSLDRAAERWRLTLDTVRPVGLVLFGGQGSWEMLRIARALNRPDNVQLILICGRNEALARELRAMKWRIPTLHRRLYEGNPALHGVV